MIVNVAHNATKVYFWSKNSIFYQIEIWIFGAKIQIFHPFVNGTKLQKHHLFWRQNSKLTNFFNNLLLDKK